MNDTYAREITEQWNVPAFGNGYVVRWEMNKEYLSKFKVENVGGDHHNELWVPAEELEEFNSHIIGKIKIMDEHTIEKDVIVEQTFDAPAEKVWKAITDREEMVKWYFDNIPDFRPEVGFQTGFDVESDGRVFPHRWKITEVEPMKKITYEWSFSNYPGIGTVTFELFDQGDKTMLRLINKGIENFPSSVPEFSYESCKAGWEYFIQGKLKEYFGD